MALNFLLIDVICPIITVNALDSSLKDIICVELDSYADTSIVASNVLVTHDHKCYVDVYGYGNKSRHKIIKTFDATVEFDGPLTNASMRAAISHD